MGCSITPAVVQHSTGTFGMIHPEEQSGPAGKFRLFLLAEAEFAVALNLPRPVLSGDRPFIEAAHQHALRMLAPQEHGVRVHHHFTLRNRSPSAIFFLLGTTLQGSTIFLFWQ